MSQPKSHTHCYLCGQPLSGPLSADHVPPQLFFPKDWRRKDNIDNLLTITTHRDCNTAWQLDEEYFVHTLLPMTKGSEAGDAHHAQAHRKLQAGRNVPLINMVMNEFRHIVRGVHLPANRVAKLIDHRRFRGVLWKIIRGLHYHHTGHILPSEWDIRYWIAPPYEGPPEEVFPIYSQSGRAVIRGDHPKVFAYFFDHFPSATSDPCAIHYWGFHLWDSITVTAMFHDLACGCEACEFIGPTLPQSMPGTVRVSRDDAAK